MPELPEVQTIVNELKVHILEKKILSCRIFRSSVVVGDPQVFSQKIQNARITDIQRKGKYLLFRLNHKRWLVSHLRMTGKFIVSDADTPEHPHDRVTFYLDNQKKVIFNDVRCFGMLEIIEALRQHSGITNLGWDPWAKKLTSRSLYDTAKNRRISIKSALLNQSIIAGIGNIYASEILFQERIHPLRLFSSITLKEFRTLLRTIRRILTLAIESNGTTISDYKRVDEKTGEFQNFLKVYGKAGMPCDRCSDKIVKIKQNQRSSFLCPTCQAK